MSTRRKQSKPKAFKDGEMSEEYEEYDQKNLDEGKLQKEKRIKLEIDEVSEGNEAESLLSSSRSNSGSQLTSAARSLSSPLPHGLTAKSNLALTDIKCIFCEKAFSNITALQNHTIAEHMNLVLAAQEDENGMNNEGSIIKNSLPKSNCEASSLVCQQCGASMPTFVEFGQHMRIHMNADFDLRCNFCNTSFKTPQARFTHMVEHFMSNSSHLKCKECPSAVFINLHQIHQHHLENHLEILYRCELCQKIFNTQNHFQQHLNVHNEELKQCYCIACNIPFDNNDLLAIHVQLIHDRSIANLPFAVNNIDTIAIQKSDISLLAQVENRSVKCSVCDIKFENEDELDSHRLQCHCKVLRSDRCADCQQEIKTIGQFLEHIRLHVQNQKTVMCIVCRQQLRNDAQIESHAVFHMQETQIDASQKSVSDLSEHEGEYKCDVCLQTFPDVEQLHSHMIEHFPNGHCVRCKLNVDQQGHSLVNHVKSCQFRQQLFCPRCKRAFYLLSNLRNHKCTNLDSPNGVFSTDIFLRSLHDGHPPILHQNEQRISNVYQCPFCPKVFASESALQGHSHIHSPRAFRCDLCTLSFSSNTRLETHRRKHFTEKNFTCQICDMKFQNRNDLALHMKIHGGNLTNTVTIKSTNS